MIGRRRMLALYLLSGVIGAFTHFTLFSDSNLPVVSASRSISGLFGAVLWLMGTAQTVGAEQHAVLACRADMGRDIGGHWFYRHAGGGRGTNCMGRASRWVRRGRRDHDGDCVVGTIARGAGGELKSGREEGHTEQGHNRRPGERQRVGGDGLPAVRPGCQGKRTAP